MYQSFRPGQTWLDVDGAPIQAHGGGVYFEDGDPNPAEWASADSLRGPWITHGNPCRGPDADITFYAQSTFVLPVAGMANAYIALFDRWNKHDLAASRYVWLPIRFAGSALVIDWHDEWDLSIFDA